MITARARVFLAQLDHRVRTPPGPGIRQPHRLHRPEAQRLASAPRDLFNRQAGLEIASLVLFDMGRHALGREHSVQERLVFGFIERAVQIVVRAVQRFAVARRPERYREIDRLGVDNRADAVVEKQPGCAGETRDLCGKRV